MPCLKKMLGRKVFWQSVCVDPHQCCRYHLWICKSHLKLLNCAFLERSLFLHLSIMTTLFEVCIGKKHSKVVTSQAQDSLMSLEALASRLQHI